MTPFSSLFACLIVLFFIGSTCATKQVHPSFVGLGPDNVTQHSGYITVNGTVYNGAHLFYWMFESRSKPKTDPFILWLTGGPGCASELALFFENGPYSINKDLSLKLNPYSWNSFANLLYVDQPVGTGFSYADYIEDYVINEKQVAQDMFVFLQQFFQMYPQYAKLDMYILGESYAGHYVPAIGHRIQLGNRRHEGININLKGLAIGNGWVDPYLQYPGYADFAYQNNLIDYVEYLGNQVAIKGCQSLISNGAWLEALEACNLVTEAILAEIGVTLGYFPNVYDYAIPCANPPLCYDFSIMDTFLAQPAVQKALGVSPNADWSECNQIVHTLLLDDWIVNLDTVIPALLNDYRMLVYSGELDYICNWVGGYSWCSNLVWPGQKQFNALNFTDWHVSGQVAGAAKNALNLTFLKVANAGHMVPMDQPKNALDMLRRFLKNQPFN